MTNHTRTQLVVPLLLALVLGIAGCGDGTEPAAGGAASSPPTGAAGTTAAYPVDVESCGRTTTYDRPPSRVVLGFPGSLATLDALGVADSVYGYALGSYAPLPDGYPADIVEVSPDYSPSREAMIGARPDLFLANDEGQVTGEGSVSYADLDGVGADTYVLGGYCLDGPAPRDLDVVYDDVAALGRIYGVTDRATLLVGELQRRVAAAADALSGRSLRVAIVQAYDGKLYALSGYPGSGIITALGQVNEFGDLSANFAEISKEEALTRAPDVLFVAHTGGDEDAESAAVAEVEKLLAGTPAVRAGHVYGLDDRYAQAGGVSVIDELEYVAGRLAAS
jgi:iron complex transport system substrate-binding protein